MKQIYLVPSIEDPNPWMYCNYARMNPREPRCLNCNIPCIHKGKNTVVIIKRK